MLVVTIDLKHSYRNDLDARIATIKIVNDGTGTPISGNYDCTMEMDGATYKRRIEGWPRKEFGAYELVAKVFSGFNLGA